MIKNSPKQTSKTVSKAKSKAKSKANSAQYWLLKSEPEVFSIQDLEKAKNKTTCWDGVRNYQARNFMRDTMKVGDLAFYYHSNSEPSAIAGIVEIVKEGYADHTAFDENDPHFDIKSKKDNPTWFMVDVRHVKTFKQPISLDMLRAVPGLEEMALLQKGSRLSVQPVKAKEWELVCKLAQ